jgi:hypothetical protein
MIAAQEQAIVQNKDTNVITSDISVNMMSSDLKVEVDLNPMIKKPRSSVHFADDSDRMTSSILLQTSSLKQVNPVPVPVPSLINNSNALTIELTEESVFSWINSFGGKVSIKSLKQVIYQLRISFYSNYFQYYNDDVRLLRVK